MQSNKNPCEDYVLENINLGRWEVSDCPPVLFISYPIAVSVPLQMAFSPLNNSSVLYPLLFRFFSPSHIISCLIFLSPQDFFFSPLFQPCFSTLQYIYLYISFKLKRSDEGSEPHLYFIFVFGMNLQLLLLLLKSSRGFPSGRTVPPTYVLMS